MILKEKSARTLWASPEPESWKKAAGTAPVLQPDVVHQALGYSHVHDTQVPRGWARSTQGHKLRGVWLHVLCAANKGDKWVDAGRWGRVALAPTAVHLPCCCCINPPASTHLFRRAALRFFHRLGREERVKAWGRKCRQIFVWPCC